MYPGLLPPCAKGKVGNDYLRNCLFASFRGFTFSRKSFATPSKWIFVKLYPAATGTGSLDWLSFFSGGSFRFCAVKESYSLAKLLLVLLILIINKQQKQLCNSIECANNSPGRQVKITTFLLLLDFTLPFHDLKCYVQVCLEKYKYILYR